MNLKTVSFILFALLLAACAAQPATATLPPSPTLTPVPSDTPTPAPTLTPTVTPIPPLPPEIVTATALFESLDYDPSAIEFKMSGGVVVGIDKATGKEIFRDGRFDLRYAVENVKDPMPTKYKPRDESEMGRPNRPPDIMQTEYFRPLFMRAMEEYKKLTGLDLYPSTTKIMLDPDKLAYGSVTGVNKDEPNTPQYLIYETSESEIVLVPLKSISPQEVANFWVL